MRHIVVTPFAAFILFLLLVLMVQLAGLNVSKPKNEPVELAAETFNVSEMSFSQPVAETIAEPELIEDTPPVEQPPEPLMEFKPIEVDSPLAEIMENIEANEATPDTPPELDIDLRIDASNDILDGIAIAAPEKIKPKKKKPIVKKIQKPKKIVKKVTEAVAKPAPAKPVSKQVASNKPAKKAAAGPISRVKPTYPKRARRRGIEGEVVASFVVNKNGSVSRDSIRIVRANPAKIFDKEVRKALAKWKFSPTDKAYRTQYTLDFSLKK